MELSVNSEVVQMYENIGMTIEEIAADTGYEPAAVKSLLLQCSRKYREETRKDKLSEDAAITPEEDKQIIEALKNMALYDENSMVRVRAAIYVHDEFKGRNDKVPEKTVNFNVLMLNEALKKAKQITHTVDIDVEEVSQHA